MFPEASLHSVSILRTESHFTARAGQVLLDAGLTGGVPLPYSCRGGTCGACRCRVLSGRVLHLDGATALSRSDLEGNHALLCRSEALSDLVLDVALAEGMAVGPPRRRPARVISVERHSAEVAVVRLRLPPNDRLGFKPGQYVGVVGEDGRARPFSIANAPRDDNSIELHVARLPGGALTNRILDSLQPGERLQVEGPFGSFGLSPDPGRPVVAVAGGTGYAPIKAIAEAALLRKSPGFDTFWGARTPEGFYGGDGPDLLASRLGGRLTRVVSGEAPGWSGPTGPVHRAVLAERPDLSGADIYVCGSPAMVEAARRDFVAEGRADPDRIFADSFHVGPPAQPAGGIQAK